MAVPGGNTVDLHLIAISDLLGKNFFIPDYQRGYRWEKSQVLQLIEDLHNFFNPDVKLPFYCLQPIVVKECSEDFVKAYNLKSDLDGGKWYEVIDGQQRLTTLRIMFAFYQVLNPMNSLVPYRLSYATRPALGSVFDQIKIKFKDKKFEIGPSDELKKNIDLFYMQSCGQTILDCFNHTDTWEPGTDFHLQEQDLLTFFHNLLMPKGSKSVQVLWYNTVEQRDARDIFERVNDLKIPLSNSELIRALFLSSTANYPSENSTESPGEQEKEKENKQQHIKNRWDEIEHRLRREDFWSFITNRQGREVRNRIEILFDLISGKYTKEKEAYLNKEDTLYTFLYFDLKIKKGESLWQLWKQIEACYVRLCSWYENDDYYHRIGYLIYLQKDGDEALTRLLHFAVDNTRKMFDAKVVSMIKEKIPPSLSAIQELDYTKTPEKIVNLLILHNVETCRQSCDHNAVPGRFPFRVFKEKERMGSWTLEHIHAQNSECLDPNNKQEWEKWAEANAQVLESLKPIETDAQLLDDLRDAIEKLKKKDKEFSHLTIVSLFDRVLKVHQKGSTPVIHSLSNLALLDQGINSGIGKSVFEVKRRYIAKLDADGEYIPYCTKKVFFKYYSACGLSCGKALSWDETDRECYLKDIEEKLADYLL